MKSNFDEKKFLTLIQKTLFYGVVVSVFLLIVGFPLFLYKSNDILIGAGLLLLILTPVLRVFMLLYGFFRLGEYNFAFAAFIVLVLMFISMLV